MSRDVFVRGEAEFDGVLIFLVGWGGEVRGGFGGVGGETAVVLDSDGELDGAVLGGDVC